MKRQMTTKSFFLTIAMVSISSLAMAANQSAQPAQGALSQAVATAPAAQPSTTPQTPSTGKLAICDANEVFFRSKAVQAFEQHREEKLKEYQKSFMDKEASLRTAHQQLEDKIKLGKEAYTEAEKKFQAQVDAERKRAEEARRKIDQASVEAEKRVKEEILKAVLDLKKKQGLSTVFDKGAILISDEVVDITEDVAKLLNERLPKVQVTIPPVKG